MGGQRRSGAMANSRKAPTGERKQGSGQKPASGPRRNTAANAPKVRKTASKPTSANTSAGSLAADISALVDAIATPTTPQPLLAMEQEANALLADVTPTIKMAALRPRLREQDSTLASDLEILSPGSSSRRNRTLASMSDTWNRLEVHATAAPVDEKAESPTASPAPSQPRAAEQVSMATRPVAAVSAPMRPPSLTKPIRSWGPMTQTVTPSHPLPEADLVLPTAAVQSALAVVAAGAAAVLALQGQSELAVTALLLTGILGLGAGLAYSLVETFASRRAGGAILIAAQLGGLLWSFLLLGYRPALLLLIPGLIILALRMAGPLAGYVMAAGAALLFCISAWASFNGYFQPRLPLDSNAALFVDTTIALVGIAFLTWALFGAYNSQAGALTFARARRFEAASLREQLSKLRRETEEDGEQVQRALISALTGDEAGPTRLRGMLSPLGEGVMALAERIQTLQRDREERLRLEGALRRMILAAHRKRLGLPWTWPQQSGTLADELIAVLPGPKADPAPGTLEKELESLAQISDFDSEELTARPRVPSWPRPASRSLATVLQSRKRPAYLRPVDILEDADTPPMPLPLSQGPSNPDLQEAWIVDETWDASEPQA